MSSGKWPSPFTRNPCSGGSRPVRIVACAASVSGALVKARSKRVPVAASLSKAGVAPSGAPYAPSRSARVVSRVTSNTFGRAAALDATARTVTRKHVRRPPGRKFDGFMESGAAPGRRRTATQPTPSALDAEGRLQTEGSDVHFLGLCYRGAVREGIAAPLAGAVVPRWAVAFGIAGEGTAHGGVPPATQVQEGASCG